MASQFQSGLSEGSAYIARNVDMAMSIMERSFAMQREKELQPLRVLSLQQAAQKNQIDLEFQRATLPTQIDKAQATNAFHAQKARVGAQLFQESVEADKLVAETLPEFLEGVRQLESIENEDDVNQAADKVLNDYAPGYMRSEYGAEVLAQVEQVRAARVEQIRNRRLAKAPPTNRFETRLEASSVANNMYPVTKDPATGEFVVDVDAGPTQYAREAAFHYQTLLDTAETREELMQAYRDATPGAFPPELAANLRQTYTERIKSLRKQDNATAGNWGAVVDLQKQRASIDNAISLIKEDGALTGPGTGMKEWLYNFGALLGNESDWLNSRAELKVYLGDQIMARVSQTKGAVSEKEMDLFQQYSPSPDKTEAANLAILEKMREFLVYSEIRQRALKDRKVDLASMTPEERNQVIEQYGEFTIRPGDIPGEDISSSAAAAALHRKNRE